MNCPICGYDIPKNAKKCPHCGRKCQSVALFDAVLHYGEATPKSKKSFLVPVVAGVLVLACIVFAILWWPESAPPNLESTGSTQPLPQQQLDPFIRYKDHICVQEQLSVSGHLLHIFQGDTSIDSLEVVSPQYERSMDGSTMVVWDDRTQILGALPPHSSDLLATNVLYVIRDGAVKKVAEGIEDYRLSIDGCSIVYRFYAKSSRTLGLHHYNVLTGEKTILDYGSRTPGDYVISPNGQYVAYKDGSTVYLASLTETKEISSTGGELLTVSNDGKTIFADLGDVIQSLPDLHYHPRDIQTLYFNADHSQVMGFYMGCSFIFSEKSFQTVATCVLTPVIPSFARSIAALETVTLPFQSLFGQVCTGRNESTLAAWYLTKEKMILLSQVPQNITYDSTGEKLYFFFGDKLQRVDLTNIQNEMPEKEVLLQGMTNWNLDFSSDGSILYYCKEQDLYRQIGKGISALIHENIREDLCMFCVSRQDVLYYMADDVLYAATENSYDISILNGVRALYKAPNGLVYAKTMDDVWLLDGILAIRVPIDWTSIQIP